LKEIMEDIEKKRIEREKADEELKKILSKLSF